MSRRSSLWRPFIIWTGPILTMVLLVLGGFLYWTATTTAGARWALVTGVRFLDGEVSGVSGSLWNGLRIGQLSLPLPDTNIHLRDFYLQAEWKELLSRRVHLQELSVGELNLALTSTDKADTDTQPFEMPALPVQIRVDRLGLGELFVSQDGKPVPVQLGNLISSVLLDQEHGRLGISSLHIGNEQVQAQIDGEFTVQALSDPWPFDMALSVQAVNQGKETLLCAHSYLPALPRQQEQAVDVMPAAHPAEEDVEVSAAAPACAVNASIRAQGSLQNLALDVQADGQGMALKALATLTPLDVFPLKDASLDLTLADASSLHARVDWTDQGSGRERLDGSLRASRLNVGQWLGPSLPSAMLTAAGEFNVQLKNQSALLAAGVDLDIAEGSVWNDQPLAGVVQLNINNDADSGMAGSGSNAASAAPLVPDWRQLRIHDVNLDLRLGNNHIQAQGDFGVPGNQLQLNADAPALAAFWPDLPGGAKVSAKVQGGISQHTLSLETGYTPENSQPDQLGLAPVTAELSLEGGWRARDAAVSRDHATQQDSGASQGDAALQEGWFGAIQALNAQHAGLGVTLTGAPSLRIVPDASGANDLWQLGAAQLGLSLDGRPVLDIRHAASSGGSAGQWATKGQVDRLIVSQALIKDIQQVVARSQPPGQAQPGKLDRGGVKVAGAANAQDMEIVLGLDWDLRFDQALAGGLHVRHVSGDVLVPADPPFPLNLKSLTLDVNARPQGGDSSQLVAELAVSAAQMGQVKASAVTRVRGLTWTAAETTSIDLDANVDDLAWVSLFTGDALEFGGNLQAKVRAVSQTGGQWLTTGEVRGSGLRVIRVDDGVRLLDGTLRAHLDGGRVILDELVFPATLRVAPKEWRTAEWVSTNPEAKDGYLRIRGDWQLTDMAGKVSIALHRFPVLQRSDRYAMISGDLDIDAILPALSITGKITADAGWFGLDMLGGIPTVDSDVVVIRGSEPPQEVDVPMDISMDIEVDLGPRFYLTGYGVNSGLVGNMRVVMVDNKLTGLGALRTRGGAIETYGQRLQLRRGTITFQGDITNPILDIEALRRGLAVEAGVRVAGTAKRPKINLVSYPEVSEIEKLSWLLFGHGPDESGGDMALLLSVGTSFLGDGEPFYRKFGIDEVSMQSGELGSAGSILPVESVVSGLNSGTSDLERQFISVSKGITQGLTVSVRQALSDTGTVGRVSYRLARGLTAELSVGTVNGLALIYRWFSRD